MAVWKQFLNRSYKLYTCLAVLKNDIFLVVYLKMHIFYILNCQPFQYDLELTSSSKFNTCMNLISEPLCKFPICCLNHEKI